MTDAQGPAVAVAITSFNRCAVTMEALKRLLESARSMSIRVFLLDDGSDGTGRLARALDSRIEVTAGDGSNYWAGGMRLALERAGKAQAPYTLWLNDDVLLDDDALERLVAAAEALGGPGVPCIVAGTVRDPTMRRHVYGGVRQDRKRRNRFHLVTPDRSQSVRCDAVNGNVVLVTAALLARLPNLDQHFTHGIADFDYALRASALGAKVVVAPGTYGTCRPNSPRGTWRDPLATRAQRWQRLLGPKGLPPVEWLVFCRRHTGPLWPLYWIWPYAKCLLGRRPA